MPRSARDRSDRFKITAKAFFLTFPQAGDIPLDDIFEHFRDTWAHRATGRKATDVLVAKELHQDGQPHFHCFLRFDQRIAILQQDAFDYRGKHPNIQTARSAKAVIKYCVKEGEFRSTFAIEIKKTPLQLLEEHDNLEDFLKAAVKQCGWQNVRSFNNVLKFAERHYKKKNAVAKVADPQFDITTFINIPDEVTEFIHSLRGRQPGGCDRVKSLWLWGKSRLGKTALAKSLGRHTRIANVWNFECLDSSGEAEYLILDDIPWESWKYQYKTLLGCQQDVQFTGKYQKPTSFRFAIPAIVTSNDVPEFTRAESDWLDLNVVFVHIVEKLSLSPNLL